jgi:hypothetical protein
MTMQLNTRKEENLSAYTVNKILLFLLNGTYLQQAMGKDQ